MTETEHQIALDSRARQATRQPPAHRPVHRNPPDPAPDAHPARRTADPHLAMTWDESSPAARHTSDRPTTRSAPNPDKLVEQQAQTKSGTTSPVRTVRAPACSTHSATGSRSGPPPFRRTCRQPCEPMCGSTPAAVSRTTLSWSRSDTRQKTPRRPHLTSEDTSRRAGTPPLARRDASGERAAEPPFRRIAEWLIPLATRERGLVGARSPGARLTRRRPVHWWSCRAIRGRGHR